jgi:hypothetical protein
MLNGDLAFRSAQHLRDRLLPEEQFSRDNGRSLEESLRRQYEPEVLVENLFLAAFSRHPSPSEVERFVALLESPKMDLQDSLLVACVAVLNASEFVFVD